MTAEAAWKACEDYMHYVYDLDDSVSDEEFDRLMSDVNAVYDEYYDFHGE
jgi:hypothetical protein